MENLELVKSIVSEKHDDYEIRLMFLLELIDTYTRNLSVAKKSFYSKIGGKIRTLGVLRGVVYDAEGIRNYDYLFIDYRKHRNSGESSYSAAPYMNALSKAIVFIYREACSIFGSEKSKEIFMNSMESIKSRYRNTENMEEYIPEEIRPRETQSETAYSFAIIGGVIDYLAGIIAKDINASKALEGVEYYSQYKILPPDRRDYLKMYVLLENFIVKNIHGYTTDSLRSDIKEIFNTRWFDPLLGALFNAKNPDKIVFTRVLLEQMIKSLIKYVPEDDLQKIIDEGTRGTDLRGIEIRNGSVYFDEADRNIFSGEKSSEAAMSSMRKFMEYFYKYSVGRIGMKKTREAFDSSMDCFRGGCMDVQKFMEAAKSLPPYVMGSAVRDVVEPNLSYTIGLLENSVRALNSSKMDIFFEKLEDFNKLTLDMQDEGLLEFYIEMENFAEDVDVRAGGRTGAAALREEMKKNADLGRLTPAFRLYLTDRKKRVVELGDKLIHLFAKDSGLDKILNVNDLVKSMANRFETLKNSVDDKGEIKIETVMENMSSMGLKNDTVYVEIEELIALVYERGISVAGSENSRTALKKSYTELHRKYGFILADLLPLMPKDLFGKDEKDRIFYDALRDLSEQIVEHTENKAARSEIAAMFVGMDEGMKAQPLKEHLMKETFSEFFLSIDDKLRLRLGGEAAERAFTAAYRKIKIKYSAFPVLAQVLRTVPKGLLEAEKFDILSKEELEKIAAETRKSEIMKSEFTNIAAHELKTPLVPLIGFLEMMKKDPAKYGLNEKGAEYIDVCLRNSRRLNELVADILDISKLETEEMKFDMNYFDIAKLIENAVTDMSPAATGRGIRLKAEIAGNLPQVYGDVQRITQVVANLLTNAIKFTDKGSVTVKACVSGGCIEVDVIDTGLGIRKEDLNSMFTKFFQTEQAATRTNRGTGLGLAICKEIITVHGGKIWVESEGLGKGSKISFTLPLKKESGTEEPARPQ